MDKAKVMAAFNEWIRRFTENPDQFEHEFQTVNKFLAQTNAGETPTYGESCVAYLEKIIAES